MISRSLLRLGFPVGLQSMFRLERDLYFYLFVIIAMHAAVLHHLLRAGELLTLDATQKSRKGARSRGASAFRCICSLSMVVVLILLSLIPTSLVSTVALHPSSHT